MGVDNGGTSSKAVLFDLQGREVASAKRSAPMDTPKVGFTERDMELLWQMNCEVIRETIERANVPPGDIAGVSFTGHGKGLYLWGKDEKPVRPGIISTDSRAYAYVERWNRDGTAERAFPLTCQSVLACQPVSLLKWLMDHEPETIEQTKWIFGVKDYVRYRLTGEAHGEITDLSGSSLVNLHTAGYDERILALFGLETIRDKLPPLVYSSELCGKVTPANARLTGLAAGTPVAAGLFDIDACAIAMNVVDDRYLASIAGTWSINEYIAKAPVIDRSVMMNSLYCLPGYYLVEESSPTSASNQEWFINNFLKELAREQGQDLYEVAGRLVESVAPDGQHIVFLPYLFGGCDDARATGTFVGLNASHTRADMLRAVYEGIVFGHKLHIDRLLHTRKTPPQAIRLAGGVVNAPAWVQMFADILQLRIETVDVKELGTLGAAMTAAVATGAYANLEQAAAAMVKIGRIYRPNPAHADAYERKYQSFLAINEALAGAWGKLIR